MLLGQIIDRLNAFPDEILITVDGAAKGITNAHSYRGAYDSIAVEPTDLRSTVGDAKSVLSAAAGRVYMGWKGGWYAMTLTTPVYIAERGDVGRGIAAVRAMPLEGVVDLITCDVSLFISHFGIPLRAIPFDATMDEAQRLYDETVADG